MKTLLLFFYLAVAAQAANFYLVTQPLTIFTDVNGQPLNNGYIYFGSVNQNPIVAPIQMTWDSAGTIPATQPLRTINGYIARQGTPANIYAPSAYSILVQNSSGSTVFSNPNSLVQSPAAASGISLVDAGNYYTGNENVEAAFQVLGPLIGEMVTALAGGAITGEIKAYTGTTAPAGYVLGDGLTIGNASSGGTERHNADTVNLFTLLWNTTNTSVTAYPSIQDSTGNPTTRGASAAADFAANDRFPLPDLRGRALAGVDNMGGTAANRLTNAGASLDGTVPLNAGGTQSVTLTTAQMPSHTHTFTGISHTHTDSGHVHGGVLTGYTNGGGNGTGGPIPNTITGPGNSSSAAANISSTVAGGTNASTGGGGPHAIVQPTITVTYIIKL